MSGAGKKAPKGKPAERPPERNCPTCDGNKGHFQAQNSGPDRWIECPTCEGSGKV